VSRPAPSGADQIDAQHQATDLAVRRSVLILESEMERRAFLASLASVVGAAASNGPAPRRVTPPSPGHLQLHPGSPLQRRELRRTGVATPAAAGQRISQPSGGRAVLGQVAGVVSKRAARVRVLFEMGIPRLSRCRLRSGIAFRSTSTPAPTSSPGGMSGPVLGRSSGCSVSIRGCASRRLQQGRHEP
jgi:hypothetical protein